MPKASRWPAVVWSSVHTIVAISVLASGLPPYVKIPVIAALIVRWLAERPARTPIIIGSRTGPWALPEFGLYNLRLSPRTLYSTWWVLLRLNGADVRDRAVLILADQLASSDWRELQIALREMDWGPSKSS